MFVVVHNDEFLDDYECDKCNENIQLHKRILTLMEIAHAEKTIDATFNSVCLQMDDPDALPTPRNSTGRWITQRRRISKPPHLISPVVVLTNRYDVLSDSDEELIAPSDDVNVYNSLNNGKTSVVAPSGKYKLAKKNLIIGDSILRNVNVSAQATVKCLPGARATDVEANLKFLAHGKHIYAKTIIHVGINDIRLKQSEITKSNIISMCNVAKQMSDVVICSGPIPARRGNETYSRLLLLNNWMSEWCTLNNIGFIDNWTCFLGKPELLYRDGLHPSRKGVAIITGNLERRLILNTD